MNEEGRQICGGDLRKFNLRLPSREDSRYYLKVKNQEIAC